MVTAVIRNQDNSFTLKESMADAGEEPSGDSSDSTLSDNFRVSGVGIILVHYV